MYGLAVGMVLTEVVSQTWS